MSREDGKKLVLEGKCQKIQAVSCRYFRTSNVFAFRIDGERSVRVEGSDLYGYLCSDIPCDGCMDISVIQYLFVLNWKVAEIVRKQEHRYRLHRCESPWVELEVRSKGNACGKGRGRPRISEHGGVKKVEYEEARDNLLVALKYKDEAWFVEYYRRICLYEGKEYKVDKALRVFREGKM